MRTAAGLVQASAPVVTAADLIVVRPLDALRYIAQAERGDRLAACVMVALNHALRQIDAAPGPEPAVACCGCSQPIRTGVRCSFVLSLSQDGGAAYGTALVVCRRCAIARTEVRRKAIVALRRAVPGLRVVETTHANGGRA